MPGGKARRNSEKRREKASFSEKRLAIWQAMRYNKTDPVGKVAVRIWTAAAEWWRHHERV
jgi:hypothetical protein